MRVSLYWAKSSKTLLSSLVAGVMVASSLLSAAPVLADSGTVTVNQANLQGWSTADTRPGGTVNFVSDAAAPSGSGALHLTTDSTNAAKAQLLHAASTPLSTNLPLSYYTKQTSVNGTTDDPSYQVAVDLNNDGTTDTNLVFEPYWNTSQGTVTNNVWQHWNVTNGEFWSSKTAGGLTAGAGGPPFYTIAQVLALNPNAVVTGFGVNVGTYNPSYDVRVDSLVFNTATYDFEVAPTPTTVYVDKTYTALSAGGHVFGYDAFTTIQGGVDAVAGGGKVIVDAGAYTENVSANKSVSLLGANSGVDGASSGRSSEAILTGSVTVTASNVSIDGFTIYGPVGSSAVTMQGGYTNETVTNNIIDNEGYAVNFNTGSTTISHNKVVHGGSAFSGVEANSNPGGNLTFDHNTFSGSDNVSADITVIGNAAPLTHNVTVTNNVSTSGTSLLALFNSKNVTITGNTYNGDNSSSALYIGGSDSNVTITGNVINKAATAIKVTLYPGAGYVANSNVTAHNNQLGTSNTNGFNVVSGSYSGATVDATGNWWGNASGPTDTNATDGSTPATNPGGTGTTALGAVNYANFCVLADCSTPTQTGGSGSGSGSTSGSTTNATTVSYIVIGGSSRTRSAGTASNTGSTSTSDTTSAIGQILGTSTSNGNSAVKGATTKKIADSSKKNSSSFLGLGWWWLLILAGVLLLLLAARRRSQQNEN